MYMQSVGVYAKFMVRKTMDFVLHTLFVHENAVISNTCTCDFMPEDEMHLYS